MTIAFVFPGQGSQAVGMGAELAKAYPSARAVFDEVDAALGQKLSDIMFNGPIEALTLTENAQPALMAVSLAVMRVLEHDKGCYLHRVTLTPATKLASLVREGSIFVNTSHREAIGQLSGSVIASARSDDGVIEAIEVPARTFALGLQWHQEQFAGTDHPGNRVFRGLIEACIASLSARRPGAALLRNG